MTPRPHEESAHWSKILFHSWIAPLLKVGQHRPLTLEDLHPTPPSADQLETTGPRFRTAFHGRVLPAIFAAFKVRFTRVFALLIILTALGLLRPLILHELISRFTSGASEISSGIKIFEHISSNITMAWVAIGCFFLLAFIRSHFLRHCFKLTWSLPGLLRLEVYESLLHLNPKERTKLTAGEYVNIATRDCDSMGMLPFLLEPLLYPITVTIYCLMLLSFLGPWALLAVIALVAVIPIGRKLERRMSDLATQTREQSRLRLGVLGEILTGIRIIKFHAWEQRFANRVLAIRSKEVALMRERARVAARHSALTALLPILTGALVVSLVAWLSGVPSTADVFASFAVISALVGIFSEIPDLLQSSSEIKISLNRLGNFLSLQTSLTQPKQENQSAECFLKNASFKRHDAASAEEIALKAINFELHQGQRTAIVGAIGSGKTTLLKAILGELQLVEGEVNLPLPVCFAPQIPWNQNASLKNNVTFQLPFDDLLFNRVIKAATLERDLLQWPGGVETEVGERGINLSGGQKQRLALARTAYTSLHQGVNTILWDDPFSALDEEIANQVFEQLLCKELHGRTRIYTTHRIDFALRADWVIVMDGGRIVQQGHPQSLMMSEGPFAKLYQLHLKTRGQEVQQLFIEESKEDPKRNSTSPQAKTLVGKLISDENVQLPFFNKKALKSYFKVLAPVLGTTGVVLIFLLPRLTDIGSNLWLGHWTSHPSSTALSLAVSVFAGFTFITVIAERMRSVVLFEGGVQAGTVYFERLLTGIMNAPMRFFDTSPQGRILNRFTSDTSAVDNSMPSSVGQFLTAFIGIFASLLPIVWSQPTILVLFIPSAFLYFWLFRWVRKAQLRLNALSQVVRSPWMSLTAETLPGLSVIQSLQAQGRFLGRYRTLINHHISTGFYVIATNLWFAFRLEILGVFLVGSFILLLAINHSGTAPMIAAVGLTFSLQMIGILGSVARSLRMLENNLLSVERMNEYASLAPEQNIMPTEQPSNWPEQGSISAKNLKVAYASDLPTALDDITFEISAGKKVGIIGRTGSGKSTLFLALTRLIPVEPGMIFIDNVDITKLSLQTLRRAISVIPQDPILFSGTLRDNLDPFNEYHDDDINISLRRAHLLQICPSAEVARGFKIEENGKNLSVGERQLICLARALLSRSKILLIDEATANVDVATDALIQQTLREEFVDCTQLVIAHRTNTLSDVDLLMRLDQGKIIEITVPQKRNISDGIPKA